MNKEYINLNENTYAVTNENGNLKVIKTNDEPDMVLKLQNLRKAGKFMSLGSTVLHQVF